MPDDGKRISPPPLEYWHSNEPARPHPIVLGVLLLLGGAIGFVTVGMIGVMIILAAVELEDEPDRRTAVAGAGAAISLSLLIACIYGLHRKRRDARLLSIESRRSSGHFFTLGLLVGCGAACLAAGSWFLASAFSS